METKKYRELEGYIKTVVEFEGYGTLWYMTRGHVDKAEFAAETNLEYETNYTVEDVLHGYAHNCPVGPDMPGVYTIDLAKGKGRGNYPITYIDVNAV